MIRRTTRPTRTDTLFPCATRFRSARVGQEFAVIADQAARRAAEGDARLAAARRAHVGQVGLADLHLLDDRAAMLVVDVDDDGFIGFGALAGLVLAIKDARAADAELKAFAAHRFDEPAELKLAAARDFKAVLVGAFGDVTRALGFGFAVRAVAT